MPSRKSLVCTLWLASSLAALAWVLVAPAATSGHLAVSPRPTGPPAARLDAATATDTVLHLSDLPSEDDEEDLTVALDEPTAPLPPQRPLRGAPDRGWIAPRSIPSPHHLRC